LSDSHASVVSLLEYSLLALSSLFVIIDPIATVPTFLAITPHDSPQQRIRMARTACSVAAGLLLVFSFAGNLVFRFLGITLAAFQLAGSIILLFIALDMLRAQRSRVQETQEETDAGSAKEDIAVTPLAVPLLAGPGAISTVILLASRAGDDLPKRFALAGCIVITCVASHLVFALSARGARWLSPIALRITTRIMGLLLAAIAMQFLLNALAGVGLIKP
jgi:multiple antibiotic resistance protein